MSSNGKPRCYSYVRFSSLKQEEGDSERRQIQAARRWAQENEYELDDKLLVDRGMSAYHSAHVTVKGALGQFLAKIKKGTVPKGSILIIESFDRLSRENVDTARERLREIVRAGVKVLTLNDRQLFDIESLDDPAKLIISIIQHSRSHEESVHKAVRLREAWGEKRVNLGNNVLYTKQVPAWLRINDAGAIEQIPDRVKLIKKMFELYVSGYGFHAISKHLNSNGHEPWNSRVKEQIWNISSVKHLLSHRALVGEFQPHEVEHIDVPDGRDGEFIRKKRIRTASGDPIQNYFPTIIESELFDEVQRIRVSRRTGAGGKIGNVGNLFTHLGICGYCGGKFTYEIKGGKRHSTYFNCNNARHKKGNCVYVSVRYLEFEEAFIKFITELDVYKILFNDLPSKELDEERKRLWFVQSLADDKEKAKANIKRMIQALGSDESVNDFAEDYKQRSIEQKRYEQEAAVIKHKVWELESSARDAEDHLKLVRKLKQRLFLAKENDKLALRHALRNSIQKLVDKIEFFPNGTQEKEIIWTGSDICVQKHVPAAEWGDLHYAESEGTQEEIVQAHKTLADALQLHESENTGRRACKVLITLKGGYKHVFAWDSDSSSFVQDISMTREHPFLIEGKPFFPTTNKIH